MSHSNFTKKKKRSSKNKLNGQKKLSIRYSTPQMAPQQSPHFKMKRSNSNEALSYNHNNNSDQLPPKMKLLSKSNKSKSANMIKENELDSSDEDELNDFNLSATNVHTNRKRRSSKKRHSAKSYDLKGVKSSYDQKLETMRLNRTVSDQNVTIENLKKEIKKYKKSEPDNNNRHNEDAYHRTIKHKEKEIANLRRRLKLAINDYEKGVKFYKKQLELFKKNQQKWLNEQKKNNKDVTKYVFVEDIKKVKMRKKGLRIYFGDGEDVVFDNIEVLKGSDDINDDDQYRNLVKKVREEEVTKTVTNINILDEDDMIILCLNELKARISDYRHRKVDVIKERYDKLPIYHVDDQYLKRLKKNNREWIKLFDDGRGSKSKKKKLDGFFAAQREIKQGKQPKITQKNNVILKNVNRQKMKGKYSAYLQNKIDSASFLNGGGVSDAESVNNESDEDLLGLNDVSVSNGWFTAQIEMFEKKQMPSIAIKNGIKLKNIQKKQQKTKKKKKAINYAKKWQKKIDFAMNGHSKMIEMDKGDSSEEDENAFSNIMSGWFLAQNELLQNKQPQICVQNNVILKRAKTKKKKVKMSAKIIQKKLNESTSNGLSKNALDLSDDSEDDILSEFDNFDVMHSDLWFYKNEKRTNNFFKRIVVSKENEILLKQICVYLNRLIPTSMDYENVRFYLPISENVTDIIAALFDGVLLSVLINFVDDNLIDLRAMHLPTNKYPLSNEQIIENMNVVSLCINCLDLHEFPHFDLDPQSSEDSFCWFNPKQCPNILLLIVMYQFMGFMNSKINIFAYPQLFRLCPDKNERKNASKCSAKEWLCRWIVFIKEPKIKNDQNLFSLIDLGGNHSPAKSTNISWDSIKEEKTQQNNKNINEYVWDTQRDFWTDIALIEDKIGKAKKTIVCRKDIEQNKNYLLQIVYLSDLFLHNHSIDALSDSEQEFVMDYLHQMPHSDRGLLAFINSFKIVDEESEFQYVDNLDDDLSNGVIFLHILSRIKEGCVDWNVVKSAKEIRHKFDELANCTAVIAVCQESFGDVFKLVGFGPNDIQSKNPKYIRSLLLQIQRYHSTKLMAKVLFKKKRVSDEELLKWMNNRLKVYKQMVSAMKKIHKNDAIASMTKNIKMKKNVHISSFEDKLSLSDSLSFLNIVSSINPTWINYKFVFDEEDCKKNTNLKIQNAKYLITIMRRLQCENIFSSPKQLIHCGHNAILTISTAIITIAARYNEYDQLALFAKNLQKIKAKMQKK